MAIISASSRLARLWLVLLVILSICSGFSFAIQPIPATVAPTSYILEGVPSNVFLSATADELSSFVVNITSTDSAAISVLKCSDNETWLSPPTSLIVAAGKKGSLVFNVLISSIGLNATSLQAAVNLTGCFNIVATNAVSGSVYFNSTVWLDVLVKLKCDVGTSSSTGLNHPSPCTYCPLGTFSSSPRSISCTPCSDAMPRTLSIGSASSSACRKCPLGAYCPIGSSPILCPASGGYEPFGADVLDRSAADCVKRPCSRGYWCGAGAAEGSTYREVIKIKDVQAAAVLGQPKIIPLTFQVSSAEVSNVTLDLISTVPEWLTVPSALNLSPGSQNSAGAATFDSTFFGTPSSELFGKENTNVTLRFSWYSLFDPATVFYADVLFDFTLVTVIVTPDTFVYSIAENDNVLNPPIPTAINVFNTMCNFSVTMTIQNKSCSGNAFPDWFSFDDDNAFATTRIEEQAGLPTVIKFGLNSTGLDASKSQIVANGTSKFVRESTPASTYESTCIRYEFIVNGPEISVTRLATLQFRLLRFCPPGTFSLTGDDAEGCQPCSLDSYQSERGKTFCNKCPEAFPRTRQVGTIYVEDCVTDRGRFFAQNSSYDCPSTADCASEIGLTVRTISVRSGYWRSSPESLRILECPRPKYCQGGKIVSPQELAGDTDGTANSVENNGSRRLEVDSLSDMTYVDNQCISNHTGPFCYTCVEGSTKRTVDKICTLCTSDNFSEDRGRVAGLFFLFSMLALGVLFLAFFFTRRWFMIAEGQTTKHKFEEKMGKIFTALDITIPLQIFISFLQVVSSMSGTFRDVLPPFYVQLRQVFSLLALDLVNIIDFGCALSAQNHFSSLLLSTLLPFAFIFVLFFIGYVLQKRTEDPTLKQEFRNATFTVFLVTTFLVYPMCSNRVLATFVCQALDDNIAVLATDPSISCSSDQYLAFRAYAVFMVLVYPVGIPLLYCVLLFKERSQMYQYYSDNIKLAVAMRTNNKDIRYLKFLWRPYKPAYFYFEVFELVRKLAQTSIVVFIAPGSSPQIVFQLLTTVISVVVLNSFAPYLVFADGLLALVAQWTLFGISLTTLLIKFNQAAKVAPEYNQDSLNTLLTLMFFSVPLAAIIRASSQVLGELLKLFTCFDSEAMLARYRKWRNGFVLQTKANRREFKRKPEKHTARRKSGGGGPAHGGEKKNSLLDARKASVENELKLLQTKDGAAKVLEILKTRFKVLEDDILQEIETERKENDELLAERRLLREDIQQLESRLQDTKIRQIFEKDDEDERREAAAGSENDGDDNQSAIFGKRRPSFIPLRGTIINSLRRRTSQPKDGNTGSMLQGEDDLEANKEHKDVIQPLPAGGEHHGLDKQKKSSSAGQESKTRRLTITGLFGRPTASSSVNHEGIGDEPSQPSMSQSSRRGTISAISDTILGRSHGAETSSSVPNASPVGADPNPNGTTTPPSTSSEQISKDKRQNIMDNSAEATSKSRLESSSDSKVTRVGMSTTNMSEML